MPSDPSLHRRCPAARRLARTRERAAPVFTCRTCAHGHALPRVPRPPVPTASLDIADDAIGVDTAPRLKRASGKPYRCCQSDDLKQSRDGYLLLSRLSAPLLLIT